MLQAIALNGIYESTQVLFLCIYESGVSMKDIRENGNSPVGARAEVYAYAPPNLQQTISDQ